MRMVGHTDCETTRSIYTHHSAARMAGARAKLGGMFSCNDSRSCRKVHRSPRTPHRHKKRRPGNAVFPSLFNGGP